MTAIWIVELVLKSLWLLVEILLLTVFSPFILLYIWLNGVAFRARFVRNACKSGLDRDFALELSKKLKLRNIFDIGR